MYKRGLPLKMVVGGDFRFHPFRGGNVLLNENRTRARRRASFANSIVFSDRALNPNEMFMVRIEQIESGWSGHLRIGLSQIDPSTSPVLPSFALPDLNSRGDSWVVAISRADFATSTTNPSRVSDPLLRPNIPNPMSSLGASASNSSARCSILPAECGSCIGVYFVVSPAESLADMHLVVNGHDHVTHRIPYAGRPLFAVADIYGNTKQVRVARPCGTLISLQELCRKRVLSCVYGSEDISKLPLPPKVRKTLADGYDDNTFLPRSLMQKLL